MPDTREVRTILRNVLKQFGDAVGAPARFIYVSARTQARFGAEVKAVMDGKLSIELDPTIPFGQFYLTSDRMARGEFGV